MNRFSKCLAAIAAVVILLGVIVFGLKAMLFSNLGRNDVYLLETRYAPNGEDAYKGYRTYDNLYQWTKDVMLQRNRYALRSVHILALSCVVVGTVLIGWSVDREGMLRKMDNNSSTIDKAIP